jgi:hypothetical protein
MSRTKEELEAEIKALHAKLRPLHEEAAALERRQREIAEAERKQEVADLDRQIEPLLRRRNELQPLEAHVVYGHRCAGHWETRDSWRGNEYTRLYFTRAAAEKAAAEHHGATLSVLRYGSPWDTWYSEPPSR